MFIAYCYNPTRLIEKGIPHQVFAEVLYWLYEKGFSRPMQQTQHPLLIARPVWIESCDTLLYEKNSRYNNYWTVQNSYVCCVDAPILSLLAWNGGSNGVVVSVDSYVATVACVFSGKIIETSVNYDDLTPEKVAEMTVECVKKCSEDQQSLILRCVLLRGEATTSKDFEKFFSSKLSSLGLKFNLVEQNEKLRDVIRGAEIFVSQPQAKSKFAHILNAAPLPNDYITPGNVSWEGLVYRFDRSWALYHVVVNRKKKALLLWKKEKHSDTPDEIFPITHQTEIDDSVRFKKVSNEIF